MFEKPKLPSRKIWKVLPIAGLALVGAILIVVYLSRSGEPENQQLPNVLRSGNTQFDWYQRYVHLRKDSLKIQLGRNYAGNRMVMFTGVIENGGEKTLDVVEVKLVLFNFETPVWETVKTPIRPGPHTPPIPPLKKRSFTLYVETIPESWRASSAEMWINGFRFKQ